MLCLLLTGYYWTQPTAAFSWSLFGLTVRQHDVLPTKDHPSSINFLTAQDGSILSRKQHIVLHQWNPIRRRELSEPSEEENDEAAPAVEDDDSSYYDSHDNASPRSTSYDLGAGKNPPLLATDTSAADQSNPPSSDATPVYWNVPDPVAKPETLEGARTNPEQQQQQQQQQQSQQLSPKGEPRTTRRMVARDNDSQILRAALWDEQHYVHPEEQPPVFTVDDTSFIDGNDQSSHQENTMSMQHYQNNNQYNMYDDNDALVRPPTVVYPDIDMSIPDSAYQDDGSVDLVWDLLRWEAYQEAQREPLLVSFLYSTILNHKTLESSLAFLLANRLASPAMMISTQLQSILLDTLYRDVHARRALRADIMAVRDRDPACNCLPDVFLYFKGFHALQAQRVAHNLWTRDKHLLAHYLQSQVSQVFQIDIHPNATMGSGIMLDHGSGIVIGSTASVGNNCSILHHVTLGGSGKAGVVRHPQVQDGVLLGAGATVLGPVTLGEGSQVGAGTLVISDLPPHCVAVGVPARIIGSFVNVTEQPSVGMNQMIDGGVMSFESEGI